MLERLILPVLAALALAACGPQRSEGATVLDEEVALIRGTETDLASREIEVEDDSIVVAFVDEQLTDVRLGLGPANPHGDVLPAVEVENNLRGSGLEVALLEVRDDTRLAITLEGPQNATKPGSVRLRVRVFSAAAVREPQFAALLDSLRSWSAATNSSLLADSIKSTGIAQIDRAIARLEGAHGDPRLAATAWLVKANMLSLVRIDWRAARAAAQRAAQGFAALPTPDGLNGARARLFEARALMEMMADKTGVNPTSAQAQQAARAILAELAVTPVFGPIEHARAVHALGSINLRTSSWAEARKYFEQSAAIYQQAGYVAGAVQMRANVGVVLLDSGSVEEAARLYERMLPEIEKHIADPAERLTHYSNAVRALTMWGRTDAAMELNLKTLAEARRYKLRFQEARALLGLGNLYQARADLVQARAYFDESLRIFRAESQTNEYVWALNAAGAAARLDGDVKTALAMHREAVTRAHIPIARMRTLLEVGVDYLADGDHAAAEKAFRDSMAVDVGDPRHHARTDVKRYLASVLVEHGGGARTALAEAEALLLDSIDVCLRVQDVHRELASRAVLAELRAAQHRPAAARAQFERVFALARGLRERSANSDTRTAPFTQEQSAFRGYLELLLRNVAARGPGPPRRATKQEEDALRKLEVVRDATLGMENVSQLDSETNARVDTLLEQMGARSVRISALLKGAREGAHADELARLQFEMSELHAEIDRLRTAAVRKAPGAARAGGARAWRGTAPGVVQLAYALGREHVFAWTRSAAGASVTVLALSPEAIEREIIALGALDRQAEPERVERALDRISAVLLPRGLLPASSTTVEVLAEGRIAGIPFPGLRSPTDSAKRLVETHTVAMIASMFAMWTAQPPKQTRPYRLVALASGHGTLRSLLVADPVPKLHAATKEIRAVASLFQARDPGARIKLLLGAEGSAPTLRGIWSSGVDVLHFATHSLPDLRQPLASLLVLPAVSAHGGATYLTAGQVREWRGDAGLVFLSACESAIGPPKFAAGMPGLQSAFLRAGARGVIATLWPIEDVLAQQFSEDFYQRFTGDKSAAQALGETQRAWVALTAGQGDSEQRRRRITALAHAYYMR